MHVITVVDCPGCRIPTLRVLTACCACAARGQVTAIPPASAKNSRRLTRTPYCLIFRRGSCAPSLSHQTIADFEMLLHGSQHDCSGSKNGGAHRATDASGLTLTPDVLNAMRPLRLCATSARSRLAG